MTPAEIITQVRVLVNDSKTPYRNSDSTLLGFVNQALKRAALLRPDLFSTITTFACAVGEVVQTAPSDCIRFMEVFSVVGGAAVFESNRETMDQNYPSWPADTAATCTTWMRHPRDPLRFFIYPKAPTSQTLNVEYAKVPAVYTATSDSITTPSGAYMTALVDCVIFLVESQDDEHVNSGRAALFYKSFVDLLGATAQNKVITDGEDSGMPDKATV